MDANSSVLFVCTGNICRSPMAEALFKSKLGAGFEQRGWRVASAGTLAIQGAPPSKNTELVLEGWGLDVRGHRSRPITKELLEEFDLILTMEAGHKEALRAEFPHLAGRIFMLSELAGETRNIPDPLGSSLDEYEQTARLIDDLLNRGFKRILQLVQGR